MKRINWREEEEEEVESVDTKNHAGHRTEDKKRRNKKNGTRGMKREEEEVVVDRLREIARLVPGAKRVNHEELVREICGSWP